MKIKKPFTILISMIMSVMMISGCGSQVDEFVDIGNLNQSSVNVAEGFFQSIFTGDQELFEACYPDSFKSYENMDGQTVDMTEVFNEYRASTIEGYVYTGASLSGYNDYVVENNYDFPALQENISFLHHTDIDSIEQAQIVKLRLNFTNDQDEHLTTDAYILVYKSGSAWYVFELQNSDAEFAV